MKPGTVKIRLNRHMSRAAKKDFLKHICSWNRQSVTRAIVFSTLPDFRRITCIKIPLATFYANEGYINKRGKVEQIS